ncbi:MAG: hypothetical protein ABL899_02160 [Nitrospira sp.]
MEQKKSIITPINIIILLIVLLVLSAGSGFYFYSKATGDPNKIAQKELASTIAVIGRLMVLPTNETPTMAIVSDPEKLKDQPFFVNAKKGDRVLIYTESRKAILYSPSQHRIVEVAPINTSGVK